MADSVANVRPGVGWGWVLTAGIVTTIAGIFMLVYPVAASASVTLVLGWVLMIYGVFQFISSIMNRAEGGMWIGMLLGVLALVSGGLLAFNVLAGTITLTLLFTCWLLADGVVGTIMSIAQRGPGWGWWLTSSLISLVLGIMLISAFPSTSLWLVGVYAGVVFLFRGVMLTFLSFEVKRVNAAAA